MAEDIMDSLRRELSETQKRREKLNTLKLTFVTGLLGLGSLKLEGKGTVTYQLLYLAPLASVSFDLLLLGEHFSIRRIGKFFRIKGLDEGERQWQQFVRDNRDVFFKYGSHGFTSLAFLAAIGLLMSSDHLGRGDINTHLEWLWFFIMFLIFIAVAFHGSRILQQLDEDRWKLCEGHLREKRGDRGNLVSEFLSEMEKLAESRHREPWELFINGRYSKRRMLKRLDRNFEKWLNPD